MSGSGRMRGRLLWLAYFFPPLGGGGCQRTLKLVRYLEPLGWSSTVITTRDPDYWILDPTLLEEVPASTEVLRVRALTSHRLLRLLGRSGLPVEERQGRRRTGVFRTLRRLQGWMMIPDGTLAWARAAERTASRRIESGDIGALWTTSSPESAHVAGLAVKRRHALPWVADFRDPWVGRVTYAPPTPWHDERHRALERAVVLGADHVTVVSEAMAALYRERYPELAPERVLVLPNGVDSDDWRRADAARFESVERDAALDRGRFVLLHAGQLAHRPTVRTLLEGACRAIAQEPGLRDFLRIRFLGGNEELAADDPLLASLGEVVDLAPSRPHLEALAAMRRAGALVLLGHGGHADALLYTGKVYEYATSGRPVLALVDPGPAADLLRSAGTTAILGAQDVEGVSATLRAWAKTSRAGALVSAPPPEPLRRSWERQFLAVRAAEILAEIAP